jgi:hypothetical protein
VRSQIQGEAELTSLPFFWYWRCESEKKEPILFEQAQNTGCKNNLKDANFLTCFRNKIDFGTPEVT